MKRKVITAAIIAVLACGSGMAAGYDEDDVVTADQISADPNSYIRRDIVVKKMGCALDDQGEFTCILDTPTKSIVINASAFDYGTTPEMALDFKNKCRGTASYTRDACIFDVWTVPQTARTKMAQTSRGSKPMIMVFARTLDLYRAKKR